MNFSSRQSLQERMRGSLIAPCYRSCAESRREPGCAPNGLPATRWKDSLITCQKAKPWRNKVGSALTLTSGLDLQNPDFRSCDTLLPFNSCAFFRPYDKYMQAGEPCRSPRPAP